MDELPINHPCFIIRLFSLMLYSELSPEQISNLVRLSREGRLSATEAGLLGDYLKFAEEQEYLLCEQSL